MRRRGEVSVAKMLNEAQNAAGDRAAQATRRADYAKAREWNALAAEIARLVRAAVEAAAS